MSSTILPVKRQGDTRTEQFDFLSDLAVGETISTQVVACSVYSGIDATPSAVISGVASASGSIVSQKVTGGVIGVIYQLLVTITTSLGQTLTQNAFLTIIPNAT